MVIEDGQKSGEGPDLVTIIGNKLEKAEGLRRRLHFEVQLPRQAGLAVHDIWNHTNI